MTVNVPLKKAIEEIKMRDGLSQREIAQKLGVHNTYLSGMINSKVPLTDNMIENIHKVFNIYIKGNDKNIILSNNTNETLCQEC